MKKFGSAAFALTLLLTLALAAACGNGAGGGEEKVFNKDNVLTVTLTEDFREKDGVTGEGLVCYYESGDAFFLATAEDKRGRTFAEYAAIIAEENGVTFEEDDGLTYTRYTERKGCSSYGYLLCLYEGRNRYYVVNIGCRANKLEDKLPAFLSYARTVEVY